LYRRLTPESILFLRELESIDLLYDGDVYREYKRVAKTYLKLLDQTLKKIGRIYTLSMKKRPFINIVFTFASGAPKKPDFSKLYSLEQFKQKQGNRSLVQEKGFMQLVKFYGL